MKQTLISGIQPSGKIHLGNYLGALKNSVELQNSGNYDSYFFIADLHSLTEKFNKEEKEKQIIDLMLDLLAVGLDPKKSTLFVQSSVPAHSELYWILGSITSLGELGRMTQFKDKRKQNIERGGRSEGGFIRIIQEQSGQKNINAGLLMYPVLMASDILLYDAKVVPVGNDQVQHLEFTRLLARKFNNSFGRTFVEPKPLMASTPRLMSLDNPSKKMSKSNPSGCIFMQDSPDEILNKIKRAVTDSEKTPKFDPKNRPGISNLLIILSSLLNEPLETIEKRVSNMGYGEFKKTLTETIIRSLEPFRKSRLLLQEKILYVKKEFEKGNKKANITANKKLTEVKKRIGLDFS